MSNLRVNTLESLGTGDVFELDKLGYTFEYAAGVVVSSQSQIIKDGDSLYRVSGNTALPYTTTGEGMPESGTFVMVGDGELRQDLTNPDKGAAMVARGVVAVDSIADLLAMPEGQRKEGLRYLVKGYHAGSVVGGGEFYYDPSRGSEHDGGSVFNGFVRVVSDIVTPEMFGDDGVASDAFHDSASFSASNGITFTTGQKTYRINRQFNVPAGLRWVSSGTKLIQETHASMVSALRFMEDNVHHSGDLVIEMPVAEDGNAYRSHALFGDWATGNGPQNITFGHFHLEGGHTNINGVSFAGNANNIRGDKVTCGDSIRIGRLVMAHWGNFDSHWVEGGVYQHAPDATPTTHPHNIKINEVRAGSLAVDTGDFCGVVALSACYDIEIGSVEGGVHATEGSSPIVLLTAGDIGFAYAPVVLRNHGMRNIKIGSVTGFSGGKGSGVHRIGQALYHDKDSTPQDPEKYFAKINETISIVNIKGVLEDKVFSGCVGGSNGRGSSNYGYIKSENFREGLTVGPNDRNINVGILDAYLNGYQGLRIAGAGVDRASWPTNISIDTINIQSTGLLGDTQTDFMGVLIQSCNNVRIGNINCETLRLNGHVGRIGTNTHGCVIGNVKVNPDLYPPTYAFTAETTFSDSFSVDGAITGKATPLIPVSGGVTCRSYGRGREFYAPSGFPNGTVVLVGDRVWVTGGSTYLQICTGSGIVGSDATLSNIEFPVA